MAYFSRLTDIVTCNLTSLIEATEDRATAVAEIIREMEEGLAGARRSMQTATSNEERLRHECDQEAQQVAYWSTQARTQLKSGDENGARLSLVRKREAESLVAGLQQQFQAATATREHLTTTFRALEARLADAKRRQLELASGQAAHVEDASNAIAAPSAAQDIEDELAALKRELAG